MENANNTFGENYGKCVHSSICSTDDTELTFRKSYKGDWGDWDEQPESIDCYDQAQILLQQQPE